MVAEFAEFERGAAEATELLGEPLGSERLFFSGGKRRGGVRVGDVPEFVAGNQRERHARVAVDLKGHRSLESRRVAGEGGADAFAQLRIGGLPKQVAGVNAIEVHRPGHERQNRFGIADCGL